VSKWESGNGAPDIYILTELAKLFGVTVNDLIGDETPKKIRNSSKGLHILIMLLSCVMGWLIATGFFVAMQIWKPSNPWWLSFLYAVVSNAILLVIYASVWRYRLLNFVATSLLIWSAITCFHLTFALIAASHGNTYSGLWCVYLLGIPLQVLEVLWSFFRYIFKKKKQIKTKAKED
jgi:transcriptional regulator with XRE-family HTH domain